MTDRSQWYTVVLAQLDGEGEEVGGGGSESVIVVGGGGGREGH